jgi:hypothetical protein
MTRGDPLADNRRGVKRFLSSPQQSRKSATDVAYDSPPIPHEASPGVRRPDGPGADRVRYRPDRPDPAQPPQAQPGRLFLPRLPRRSEEDNGPVRLRRPGRWPRPRCRRADVVLLPRKRIVRLPESAEDARLPARSRCVGHRGHERFLPFAGPRGRQGGGARPYLDRPCGRTRRADDPGPLRQLAPGNARS